MEVQDNRACLTEGIEWWVVVATTDGKTGRARLTNADSVANPADVDWLMASGWQPSLSDDLHWKYFPHVQWDADGQQRLHAAIAEGCECLELTYPGLEA